MCNPSQKYRVSRPLLRSRTGQSILEYLVIATVVVLAILLIRGTVQSNTESLFNQAAGKVGEAATQLGTLSVGPN